MVKSVWAGTTTALSLAAWCAVAVAAVHHQAAAAHSRQLHYKFPDHQDGRHLGTSSSSSSSSSSDDGRRTFFEIREHCTVINTGEDRHGRTHFIINCHNGINDDDDAVYHADDYYSDDADSLGDDDYWGDDDYSGDDDDDSVSNGGGWMPSKDDDQNEVDDDVDEETVVAGVETEVVAQEENAKVDGDDKVLLSLGMSLAAALAGLFCCFFCFRKSKNNRKDGKNLDGDVASIDDNDTKKSFEGENDIEYALSVPSRYYDEGDNAKSAAACGLHPAASKPAAIAPAEAPPTERKRPSSLLSKKLVSPPRVSSSMADKAPK